MSFAWATVLHVFREDALDGEIVQAPNAFSGGPDSLYTRVCSGAKLANRFAAKVDPHRVWWNITPEGGTDTGGLSTMFDLSILIDLVAP